MPLLLSAIFAWQNSIVIYIAAVDLHVYFQKTVSILQISA